MRLEIKNKRGNCPEQLLDKIRVLHKKLGSVPTKADFKREHKGRFMGTIYETFGSWTRAVELAGLKPVSVQKKERYSNENLLGYVKRFHELNGRTPTTSDFCRGFLPDVKLYVKRFGSVNNARKFAGVPRLVRVGRSGFVECE